MNFLSGVTRVMRLEGIIRGDTDAPTTFSDLQHGATIQLAIIAIQDELNELVSDNMLAYERDSTGTVSAVAGTRSYSLPSDFVRMFGEGGLLDPDSDTYIHEYPGGEARLQSVYPGYKTDQSDPSYWYFDLTTTKKIGLFPVPQSTKVYTFDYQQDVSVTSASDTLPFHTESEAQAFCRLAARRFKFLYQEKDTAALLTDAEHMRAKATLMDLMKGKDSPNRWSNVYA